MITFIQACIITTLLAAMVMFIQKIRSAHIMQNLIKENIINVFDDMTYVLYKMKNINGFEDMYYNDEYFKECYNRLLGVFNNKEGEYYE